MRLVPTAEVHLLNEICIEQVLQRAVDRRLGSARGGLAKGKKKFLGFEGSAKMLHGVENGKAFGREFQFALMEVLAKDMLGAIR